MSLSLHITESQQKELRPLQPFPRKKFFQEHEAHVTGGNAGMEANELGVQVGVTERGGHVASLAIREIAPENMSYRR